jgi:hypothetical protein
VSAHPDTELLRLEAEFVAADDRWSAATARTAELEAAIDKAEKREAKKAAATARAFRRVMTARATSLTGLAAKLRVRDRWNTDDEDSEIAILKSLAADIEAMAKGRS